MDTVIIACKTLEDELALAAEKTGIKLSVIWLESGLHNTPKILKAKLQEALDNVSAGRVLLLMGFCGNSILEIKAGDYELIIPRVDDCISLLLGSVENRAKISKEFAAYFLTEGWLRGERNIWAEYLYSVDKYGEETAKSITETMLGHYRTLGLLDSGATSAAILAEKSKIIAETLGLEQRVIPASTGYIEELLRGPWPEGRFIVKAPGEYITAGDLGT